MAFSKTPTIDTYSSQQLPLCHDYKIKPGEDDLSEVWSGLVNVIPVSEEEDTSWGETRPGILQSATVTNATTNLSIRGMFVWEKLIGTSYIFVVVSNGTTTTVWSVDSPGTYAAVNSWADTARTPVRFAEFIDDTNTKKLIMVTGTRGYVYTSNAAGTQIVDADFPNPHVPFPVFLNGRIYLAKSLTGDIYNSNLNDPSAWTPGDFLSSEIYPDDIQALVKMDNYIMAIGSRGTEYFYDNANASGSPLARLDGGVLPFGTAAPNSIAVVDNVVVFLAFTAAGQFVFRVVEGFKFRDIPASAVILSFGADVTDELNATTPATCRGCFLRHNGELLYLFNYKGDATNADETTTPSMVYCFKEKKWVRFQFDDGLTFPVMFSSMGTTSGPGITFVAGVSSLTGIFVGALDTSTTQDIMDGSTLAIKQEVYLPPTTFGTMNKKTMSRAGVNYASPGTESSPELTIQYSDDNMETFSTARTLAGTMYSGFPFITQLGQFLHRGFKLVGTSVCRWNYLEVDINKGPR